VPTTPLLCWLARLEREALLRLRVDEPPLEREEPLALVFEPEPLDELLLRCPLRELVLLLAIPHRLSIEKSLR